MEQRVALLLLGGQFLELLHLLLHLLLLVELLGWWRLELDLDCGLLQLSLDLLGYGMNQRWVNIHHFIRIKCRPVLLHLLLQMFVNLLLYQLLDHRRLVLLLCLWLLAHVGEHGVVGRCHLSTGDEVGVLLLHSHRSLQVITLPTIWEIGLIYEVLILIVEV